MKNLYTLLISITALKSVAQITRLPPSSIYTGIGTYTRHFNDAFSAAGNPAALGRLNKPTAGVYGERRFMLKELSNYSASLALPSAWGGFGITARYFGGTNFNESEIGIGYGKMLGDKIDIGIRFNYNMTKITGYGNSGTLTAELGALWYINEQITAGIHVYNPSGGRFGKNYSEKLAAVYTSGISYESSENFFVTVRVVKAEDQPLQTNISCQYLFDKHIYARAAVSTGVSDYTAGLGWQLSWFRIDAVTNYHPYLGFTPGLLLIFQLKADKNKPEL